MRQNLTAIRRNKNMSQQELAEMVGLTRQAICRLERGRMNGSESTWKALAAALDAKPEELWRSTQGESND